MKKKRQKGWVLKIAREKDGCYLFYILKITDGKDGFYLQKITDEKCRATY